MVEGVDKVTQFALINALRTGNTLVDTALAILAPCCMAWLWQRLQVLRDWLQTKTIKTYSTRCIHFRSNDAETKMNIIALRAVRSYISHLHEAWCSTTTDSNVTISNILGDVKYFDAELSSCSRDLTTRYHLAPWLPLQKWVQVTPLIEAMWSYSPSQEKTAAESTLNLRACGPEGGKHLDEFVSTSFAWYRQKLAEREDMYKGRRYLYLSVPQPITCMVAQDANKKRYTHCRKYELADTKTFNSMFFEQKAAVTTIIEDFMGKRGRFSVEGIQHKLGFLLHGPPGTGELF